MTLADPRQRRMWSADELQRILKAADNAAGYFDNRIRRSLFLRSLPLLSHRLTSCFSSDSIRKFWVPGNLASARGHCWTL